MSKFKTQKSNLQLKNPVQRTVAPWAKRLKSVLAFEMWFCALRFEFADYEFSNR